MGEVKDLKFYIQKRRRYIGHLVFAVVQTLWGLAAIWSIWHAPVPDDVVFAFLIPLGAATGLTCFCMADAAATGVAVDGLNKSIAAERVSMKELGLGSLTLYEPRRDGAGDLEISVAAHSLEECEESEDLKEGYKVELNFVAPPEPEDTFPGYGEFIDEHGNCAMWARVQDQDGKELPPMKLHNKVRRC